MDKGLRVLTIILLVTCFLTTCVAESGLSAVHRSRRSSNDALEHLIREAMVAMTNLMKSGFPELGIPSLEPVKLDDFSYEGNAAGANMKGNFSNMNLYGLSTMQISKLKVDMSKLHLELKLQFSNLTIIGRYSLNGKMLKIFPLRGNDSFSLMASDVTVKGESSMKTFANGSLAMTNFEMDLKVGAVKSHFHKLNGGGTSSAMVNLIINFFGDSIFDKAKPKLIQKMKTALETTINRKLQAVNVFKM